MSMVLDPWWDVFLPARYGDAAHARRAVTRLLRGRPRDADALAVAARALLVLGQAPRATRLAADARALGGVEADALDVWLRPDGAAVAAERLARHARSGLRADAACDLAAVCLVAGGLDDARAAVAAARAICPDHREARRWERFLADGRAALASARATRRVGDGARLLPTSAQGWVSDERVQRRLLADAVGAGARRGSGRARLREAGVGELAFGGAEDVIELELAADDLRAATRDAEDGACGHDGALVAAATRLWGLADAHGDAEVLLDAAHLIASLAATHPRLGALGREAAARAQALDASDAPRWRAWRCLIDLGVAPDAHARHEASALLADPGAPLEMRAWLLDAMGGEPAPLR